MAIHAANRLIHEDGKYACIAACAAGGQVKEKNQLILCKKHCSEGGNCLVLSLDFIPSLPFNAKLKSAMGTLPDFQGSG